MFGGASWNNREATDSVLAITNSPNNNELHFANIANDKRIKKMPQPRKWATAIVVDSKKIKSQSQIQSFNGAVIFIVGGCDSNNSCVKRTFMYFLEKDEWIQGANLIKERFLCGLAFDDVSGNLYAIGGGYENSCEILNLTDAKWQWKAEQHQLNNEYVRVTALLHSKQSVNLDSTKRKLIAIGGYTVTVEIRDLAKNDSPWSVLVKTDFNDLPYYAFSRSNDLFVCTEKAIYSLDLSAAKLTQLAQLPEPRSLAAYRIENEKIFIFGGGTYGDAFSIAYDIAAKKWLPSLPINDTAQKLFTINYDLPWACSFATVELSNDYFSSTED